MRADGAGCTVCLSVCPGENYKALEAPADGFAPAFLWAPGEREGVGSGVKQSQIGQEGPHGPSGENGSLRTATLSVTPPPHWLPFYRE